MAVSAKAYGNFPLKALSGEINFPSNTIKCMLCNSSYVPDQDSHIYKSSVTNEVTGTNYTAGGATLASKTLTYTGATNIVKIDADDITWSNSTITAARYAVIYVDTGNSATSALICYIDFGQDISTVSGALVVQFHADGIITFTVAA